MANQYGLGPPGLFGTTFTTSSAIVEGVVTAEHVERGLRMFDVLPDNNSVLFVKCEVVGDTGDSTPLIGKRVLLAILGPNKAIIIGALQGRSAANVSGTVTDDSNGNRPNQTGTDDRVITHAGSTITMTKDGDIVLKPARALRIESASTRIATNGISDTGLVASSAFLAWAQSMYELIYKHETTIASLANSAAPGSYTPAVPGTSGPSLPTAASATANGLSAPSPSSP